MKRENNHTVKTLLFYLLFLLWATQISGQQAKFVFDYITNDDGLSHNTVYDICQDSNGFMWFSTEVGLNRYDGQTIKQYYHFPNTNHFIPSPTIPSLVYTSDNKLFAGTTKGLTVYHPETDDFKHISFNGKALMSHISSMSQGYGQELLISTENEGSFIYNYADNELNRFVSDQRIYGITTDKENTYWAYSRFNLYRYNRGKELIAIYSVSPDLFKTAISYVKTDSKGVLWVGTFESGLFTFDSKANTFNPVPACRETKMNYVRTIEEGDNEYWIGTESGLYIINTKDNYCNHYTQSFDDKLKTINDNAVYKIYRNKQNIYFIGTYFGGVNIAGNRNTGFNVILPDDRTGYLHGKALSMMAKAPDGNLWIATEDAGIAIFDKNNYKFQHLSFNEKDPQSISSNNVHTLLMDGNTCWAGHFMGGVSKIDIKTGKAKRFIQSIGNPNSLNNNFVFALHFLSPDSILVGSLSGVDLLNKRTETFSRFRENEFNNCFIYDIFTASDGEIWFCTYNNGIFILDKTKLGLMTHFKAGDDSGLTNNSIISYCIDSKNRIWIGTRGSGMLLYSQEEKRFIPCKADVLIDDVIYGIIEDDNGYFWISTNKGISRLDLSDSTSVHFNVKHGIAGNQYNYKSYFKDGKMLYFGSVTGLTWFNPETIFTPEEIPSIYLADFRIFNQSIRPDSNGILKNQIDFTSKINLKHNQNSFTFDFGVINYSIGDIAYQYYLEGFDETWSPLSDRAQANYTNISSGNYVFHVRVVNKINNTISPEKMVHIRINPPFWASWMAYLLYLVALLAILYYVYHNYRNRQREKIALAVEKIEKENLKLLHQHKLNFFTYISHEFKTPLSIIIASVEMLVGRSDVQNKDISDILQSIKRSATILLSLVNQLMEFRKIETDHAYVYVTQGNVIDFCNQVIDIYRPLLAKKHIEINVKVNYTQTEVFIDFDKLEKILTNLLTNAVKYTPQYGTIDFYLKVDGETIFFSVKDSGNGISEKKKDKIFEVFYSEGFSNDIVESSGIGLALTASLTKLLNGEISVESEIGKGSKFNVKLPHYKNAESISGATNRPEITTTISDILENTTTLDTEIKPAKEFTIVIAEDNKELLSLLNKNFREKYHVKCFENGKEAWDYMNKKIPDLVITDIMMPEMSGTELCQKIKTDINLCHIPVLMLTAKDTKEAKLEGLQMGADAYITKPFSMEELEVRINNILYTRNALKKKLNELARFEGFDIPVTNHEQAFVEKILSLIQKNIDNKNLDVQFLAGKMNISRSGLHNKMKAVMNMNTTEFINTVRINNAKELILRNEFTLSEIAYKVGYNDAAYFTRIFKKHTGQTPGEYKASVINS